MKEKEQRQLVIGWADESDHVEQKNESEWEVDRHRSVSFSRGKVHVHKDGGTALQGEVVGLDLDGPLGPALIVEGTRHAWDVGPKEWEGRFAVFGDRTLDIDGPLPEQD